MNQDMFTKAQSAPGFIAALDQSGGSTPKALRLYGIEESEYGSEAEMFDLMHAMRARIMMSPAFTGERIMGAILFEQTMDREVEGRGTADYLWNVKRVVPFLKVDKGLAEAANGVQLMKAMPGLDDLLERAVSKGVFGTKMRSLIALADEGGVKGVVDQQFEVGRQIIAAGLVPIIEPEIDINSPQKSEAEVMLLTSILEQLDALATDQNVMLKLTIPTEDNLYRPLIEHPRVVRVVALSGGYHRDDANARLARNHGMIASFSRALTEGLTAQQSDAEFNAKLNESIQGIFEASLT